MITVCEWSRLRIGWPSTFGGLCSCSLPGEAGGRHIQYHGTCCRQPALQAGDQVSDHRRNLFLGDAELTAGPRSLAYVAEAMILNSRTPGFARFVMG
jgi:hypothetical protein